MSGDLDCDVLVVGAGPAGLTLAATLAGLGVDAVTVTKYAGTANSPRAHITNQRTMEVFRDLGLEEAVRAAATPNALMGNNVWSTSFAGREVARRLTWGSGPERRSDYDLASVCEMCNIPQHLLEPIILEGAVARGADVRFGLELTGLTQDADGVTATVRRRADGGRETIRARYLVGCDGGRSTTAQLTGIPMTGEMNLGAAANVWLEVDLTRYTAHRPGTLYWMCQPGNDYWVGSGTWICVRPWDEWVLLFMYDPAEEPDLSEAALLARARTTIGDDDIPIRIKAVSRWQINHIAADTYRSGRVFIAGDAAHRHPPANGLGTNTSVQDAFNLGWKLAYVLRGQAGEALLDSYDQERQPVGRQVVDRAMKSVADMLPISQAFGFEPGQSAEDGWAALDELFAPGDVGEKRRAALASAVQLQDYQFNAHGVELDQRYVSGAVVDDGSPWPAPDRDPELFHHPTTHPGARLPHAPVEHAHGSVSTLDLCGHGGFTLLTGIGGEPWRAAAATVGHDLGVDIRVVSLGPHCDYDDVLLRWNQVREIDDTGCILVRPDHHVAWRATRLEPDAEGVLGRVMRQVLARPVTTGGNA